MPLLLCPNDNNQMLKIERSGVEIDICPTCNGVWLDRGELNKLLAAEGGCKRVQPRLRTASRTKSKVSVAIQMDGRRAISTIMTRSGIVTMGTTKATTTTVALDERKGSA